MIASNMASAVRTQVDCYRHDYSLSYETLLDGCRSTVRFVTSGILGDQSMSTSSASAIGEQRARAGIPLHGMVAASRVSYNEILQSLHAALASHHGLTQNVPLVAMQRIGHAHYLYVDSAVLAHRQRTLLQAVDDEAERAALVEALFLGRASPGRSLWEIAEMLRIPRRGPYVVVAARHPDLGEGYAADLSSRLRGLDVYSVWRRTPDFLVGIVCVPSTAARTLLLGALPKWAPHGAGVSHDIDDLVDVPTALHYARIVAARATKDEPVVVAGNAALEIAALVDPQISRRLAIRVLGALNDLPTDERDALHRTFTTWTTHGGSIPETAGALFCHPNTVRYRLQRIEQLTGRSVRAPIELAELCLAFEVAAKLPLTP
ncbi:helix-turn-helix domain-containing protein [Mycolicibacterium sp. 050158]|uniref:PucR family transcriptional regulator n=1 Tax=Mycolicibacterium sp. 050158 TaxID=3090602 RepID=UPI00299DF83C|nr:helix-turn-helix domain-containing protein [Mycolicibacterium sp. 050158]MDX1892695.1 helix-turn-helix domain-containing protein [Mycolicibacterium sp. 050158]